MSLTKREREDRKLIVLGYMKYFFLGGMESVRPDFHFRPRRKASPTASSKQ